MTEKKKIKKDAPAKFCDVHISVLGYQEDDQWIALALEMDLRGYGKTFEKALSELDELIKMQISFARFKDQPEMIFHPAESTYWKLYAQVSQDRLWALSNIDDNKNPEYRVGGLSIPPAHVINCMKDFVLARN